MDLDKITESTTAIISKKVARRPIRAECFVCERFSKVEIDHPIPKISGGKMLVPLCVSCHDDLDRSPIGKWEPERALQGLLSLWSNSGLVERLLILKLVRVAAHGQVLIKQQAARIKSLTSGLGK